MRYFAAVQICLLLLILVLPETANARPDVRRMTCSAAAALVKKNGAVVMTTGQHTYDRIVANRSGCHSPKRMIAPARDNKRCFIGYQCTPGMGGR